MRVFLLIVGIVLLVACVLSALYAALNLHTYHNLLDGTPEHYKNLHKKAIVFFIVAAVLLLLGVACLIIRAKI